jgi:hypothetical protein
MAGFDQVPVRPFDAQQSSVGDGRRLHGIEHNEKSVRAQSSRHWRNRRGTCPARREATPSSVTQRPVYCLYRLPNSRVWHRSARGTSREVLISTFERPVDSISTRKYNTSSREPTWEPWFLFVNHCSSTSYNVQFGLRLSQKKQHLPIFIKRHSLKFQTTRQKTTKPTRSNKCSNASRRVRWCWLLIFTRA